MFNDLANSECEVWGSDVSGLWTLTKVPVLVSESEHLYSRTLAKRVSVGVQQVTQCQAHEFVAKLPPGLHPQPGLSYLCDLSDQLGYCIGSVRLCAAHTVRQEQL